MRSVPKKEKSRCKDVSGVCGPERPLERWESPARTAAAGVTSASEDDFTGPRASPRGRAGRRLLSVPLTDGVLGIAWAAP